MRADAAQVHLRRRDARVSERIPHDVERRTRSDHVHRERGPEPVRVHTPRDTSLTPEPRQQVPDVRLVHLPSGKCAEERTSDGDVPCPAQLEPAAHERDGAEKAMPPILPALAPQSLRHEFWRPSGLPLHGEELIEQRRARVGDYPEALRQAMIERHWSFFPLWYYGEAMAVRDAELWRLDMLLEAAFNLLAVLAALNRRYFARFELKRMRALIAQMELAPPRLAERLESLFRLAPEPAAAELGRMVEETRALVAAELPDLELPLRLPPGTRQQPWSM